jgi:hypothetical protein
MKQNIRKFMGAVMLTATLAVAGWAQSTTTPTPNGGTVTTGTKGGKVYQGPNGVNAAKGSKGRVGAQGPNGGAAAAGTNGTFTKTPGGKATVRRRR